MGSLNIKFPWQQETNVATLNLIHVRAFVLTHTVLNLLDISKHVLQLF